MRKHHVIITGTGRAGTTFLMQLLTELKLDTGFTHTKSKYSEVCQAGMEWNFKKHRDAPYIVKHPTLCEYLDQLLLESPEIAIDHAIVPIRDLFGAAESRRTVARSGHPKFLTPLRRGFLRIRRPDDQETVLGLQIYKLMRSLAKHDIPLTLLDFPRLANEPDYLFKKLKPVFPQVSHEGFLQAFRAVARPELIHDFKRAPNGKGSTKKPFWRLFAPEPAKSGPSEE